MVVEDISARPYGKLLVFDGVSEEGVPHRTTLANVRFAPLTHETLFTKQGGQGVTIPLKVSGQIVSSDHPNLSPTQSVCMTAELQSPLSSDAVCLVPGGWLPSALAVRFSSTDILIDQNITSEIVSRFEGGVPKGRPADFLDLFAEQGVTINPSLCGIEGNIRAQPDMEGVRRQIAEITDKLLTALPNASIACGDNMITGVAAIIASTAGDMKAREKFLLEISSLLYNPVSSREKDVVWKKILEAADRNTVPRRSIVVSAALSAPVAEPIARHAQGIFKFQPSYTPEDAYNALSDLRALEIFMTVLSMFPNDPPPFCTKDRHLALFWTAMRPTGFRLSRDGASFDLDPLPEMFPGKYRELWLRDTSQRASGAAQQCRFSP